MGLLLEGALEMIAGVSAERQRRRDAAS